MPKVLVSCFYCGFEEIKDILSYQKKKLTCFRCNDKQLKFKDVETTNVFGYTEDELEDFDIEDKIILSWEDDIN